MAEIEVTDKDLVIISWNENGFHQADLYVGCAGLDANEFERISPSADSFMTAPRGMEQGYFLQNTKRKWPKARIVISQDDAEEDETD